jgi:hypothetical protein
VKNASSNETEGAGRCVALAPGVFPPAHGRIIEAKGTGVIRPHADSREGAAGSRRAPVRCRSPANHSAVVAEAAPMPLASANGLEGSGGRRARATHIVLSPTGDRLVGQDAARKALTCARVGEAPGRGSRLPIPVRARAGDVATGGRRTCVIETDTDGFIRSRERRRGEVSGRSPAGYGAVVTQATPLAVTHVDYRERPTWRRGHP